jgi:ferrous iron transport protein B
VYTLFIAAFLPTGAVLGIFTWQGVAMFSMYLLGTVMAFLAAFILRRFVFNKGDSSFFAMELPPYRMPRVRQIFWRMIDRSKAFVVRAGKIIFGMSIILWVLATFPMTEPTEAMVEQQTAIESLKAERVEGLVAGGMAEDDAVAAVEDQFADDVRAVEARIAAWQVERSFIGRMGHLIEPVMRPLGFDWKISAGIISAFAAREVIISALATIYSVGDVEEDSPLLREQLKADAYEDGSPVYTPLVAVSLLVFFVLALQCMSTLAIARRETNSWKWPAVMWLYMTGLAYLFSLVIYQGGMALGWG